MSTSPKWFLAAKFNTTNTHVINGGQYKEIEWGVGGDSWKQLQGEVEEVNSWNTFRNIITVTQFLILNMKTNYGKTQIGKFCRVKMKNIFLKIRIGRLVDEKIKNNKYINYKPLLT